MTAKYIITRKGQQKLRAMDPSAKIRLGWSFPCPVCNEFDLPSTEKPNITLDRISPFPSSGYIGPGYIEGTCPKCGTILKIKEDA